MVTFQETPGAPRHVRGSANLVCSCLFRDFYLASGIVSNTFADVHQSYSVMTILKVIMADIPDTLVQVVQLLS